jgi:glycosyltransferase involved in cell wall biosynthesis
VSRVESVEDARDVTDPRPLLSVLIPTRDRAELLAVTLESLVPQVARLEGVVEIVVSDNASTDRTRDVIEAARLRVPVRYDRTESNVGHLHNFVRLVERLARGEYCWLLGDDDMVVAGALDRLVGLLRANRDLDSFFVNYYVASVSHRDVLVREHGSQWVPEQPLHLGVETWCADHSNRRLERWEDALAVESPSRALTFVSMICQVFRRATWLAHAGRLERHGQPSLDTTYPHLMVLAHAMVGRPAFYAGEPLAVQGVGATPEWNVFAAAMIAVRVNELLGLYEQLGVDQDLMRLVRRSYVERGGPLERSLHRLLRDRRTAGRGYTSLRRLAWDNREFAPQLAAMLVRVYGHALRNQARHLPLPLRRTMRSVYRAAVGTRGR